MKFRDLVEKTDLIVALKVKMGNRTLCKKDIDLTADEWRWVIQKSDSGSDLWHLAIKECGKIILNAKNIDVKEVLDLYSIVSPGSKLGKSLFKEIKKQINTLEAAKSVYYNYKNNIELKTFAIEKIAEFDLKSD